MAPREDARDGGGSVAKSVKVRRSLKELGIRSSYDSGADDLIHDFYVPALSVSVSYDRAVGFFSSSAFVAAARGLYAFIRGGGSMRLIASPYLSPEDTTAISEGVEARLSRLAEELDRELLASELNQIAADRLKVVSWLLHHELLDVRLAWRSDGGLYHEKLGLFTDYFGNVVAFTGSPNESAAGFCDNYENIDVFRSWVDADAERAADKSKRFLELWNNRRMGVETHTWSTRLVTLRCLQKPLEEELPTADRWNHGGVQAQLPTTVHSASRPDVVQNLPDGVELRDYQKEVIRNWLRPSGRPDGRARGIFKMATGTGKTLTALAAASFMWRQKNVRAVIVVCPFRHLVEQWMREAERFGFEPIACMDSSAQWQPIANKEYRAWVNGIRSGVVYITTLKSFGLPPFRALIERVNETGRSALLVCDEVHNCTSKIMETDFPSEIAHRLGLSATPERYLDDKGTSKIVEYFGGAVDPEIGLRKALESNVLCPYDYHPIFIELDDDEAFDYLALSHAIAAEIDAQKRGDPVLTESLTSLLMRRARLIGRASGKVPALHRWLEERQQSDGLKHTLIYCGDGDYEEGRRYPMTVYAEVTNAGARAATFLAETKERESLLRDFSRGEVDVLVAIRCLDEGVDVPNIQTALMMASGRNPKQFIQRRGRLLRRSPMKSKAVIYDMIVVPPTGPESATPTMRRLLRGELVRAFEFSQLALNRIEAQSKFLGFQEEYELFDLEDDERVL